MRVSWAKLLALATLTVPGQASFLPSQNASQVQPFHIDLSSRVPRMLEQIRRTRLPANPVYVDTGNAQGITLHDLKSFQEEWLTEFDWEGEQKDLNKCACFIFQIRGKALLRLQQIQPLHNPNRRIDHPFYPRKVQRLGRNSIASSPRLARFFPGIRSHRRRADPASDDSCRQESVVRRDRALSARLCLLVGTSVNWTVADTARVFNTLLTQVLHYDTYAVFGTDWGASVGYTPYDQYNTTVRVGHLAFLPFFPLNSTQLASQNVTLNSLEGFEESETMEWNSSGEGYFIEQTTKVFSPP